MQSSILVRYSEIGIKGKNRPFFEKALVRNIKDCLGKNKLAYNKVNRYRGRIIVFIDHAEKASHFLKNVFGIASLSPAEEVDADIETLKAKTMEFALEKGLNKNNTFRITSKRINKLFPYESMKLNEIIGAFIQEKTHAKVSLEKSDINIRIEVIDKKAYVFCQKIECHAGLPVGTEGKIACLIENRADVLAAILMMRHGCEPVIVNNKNIDVDLIKKFCYGFELKNVKNIEDDTADVVVVGQTLKDYKKIKTEKLVLRPLVAYTDGEVEDLYKHYNDF